MGKKFISILLIGCMLFGFTGREVVKAASAEDPKNTTYISEDLMDFIEQKMNQGDERDAFSAMLCDKELSTKELNSYKKVESLKEYITMIEEYSGIVLKVDADNDGTDDLFFVIYDGGTMGNTSRYLLKGKTDGTYAMTYKMESITQELAFISYQQTNYLLETTFDYNSKMYDGFQLSYFKEGVKYEQVFINKSAKDYTVNTTIKDNKLKKLASTYKTKGLKDYAYDVRYDMDGNNLGTAEKKLGKDKYKKYAEANPYSSLPYYSSDLDNDKKAEIYAKDIFYTSTISTVTGLENFLFEPGKYKTYSYICDKYFKKISGTPQMFWVEKTKQGNVVCILYLDNLLDYTIYGMKITKGKAKEVFRNTFKAKSIIKRYIETRGINLEEEDM